MTLPGDNVIDLELDTDRTITVGADGDIETVGGVDNVKQSVAIAAGEAVRSLIGNQVTPQTYADVQAEIENAISRDPQIDNVDRVSVTEVDMRDGTVTVEVFTSYNESFEINVPAT